MLKLKLQYFGHLMQRINSLKKTLMLGKIEDRRRRGWQRMRWLDGITNSIDMILSKVRGLVDREVWYTAVHRVAKSWTWLNWTELILKINQPLLHILFFLILIPKNKNQYIVLQYFHKFWYVVFSLTFSIKYWAIAIMIYFTHKLFRLMSSDV